MSVTLDALARDYFAKQEAYRKLASVTPAADAQIAHELAIRDALDLCAAASMKLDEARKALAQQAAE